MNFEEEKDLSCKCGRKIIKCFTTTDSKNTYFKLHYSKDTITNNKANYISLACKKCLNIVYLEVGFKD
jgi:hypothetical protein